MFQNSKKCIHVSNLDNSTSQNKGTTQPIRLKFSGYIGNVNAEMQFQLFCSKNNRSKVLFENPKMRILFFSRFPSATVDEPSSRLFSNFNTIFDRYRHNCFWQNLTYLKINKSMSSKKSIFIGQTHN